MEPWKSKADVLRLRVELEGAHDVGEREVRDLPRMEFRTTAVVKVFRVCCPDCGIKIEKVPQLPSNAAFSKRFEDAVEAGLREFISGTCTLHDGRPEIYGRLRGAVARNLGG